MIVALALLILSAQNAPPPYQSETDATVVTLGAMGRSQGWTTAMPTAAAKDVLASTVMPAAIVSDAASLQNATQNRVITFTRVSDDASDANLAVCVRLGPATDQPALACSDKNAAGQAGGCYLTATNSSCTITIRPPTTCPSSPTYDNCHVPVWAMASGGTNNAAFLAVSPWW